MHQSYSQLLFLRYFDCFILYWMIDCWFYSCHHAQAYDKDGKLPALSGIPVKLWVFCLTKVMSFLKKGRGGFLRKIQKFLTKIDDLFPTLLWIMHHFMRHFITSKFLKCNQYLTSCVHVFMPFYYVHSTLWYF